MHFTSSRDRPLCGESWEEKIFQADEGEGSFLPCGPLIQKLETRFNPVFSPIKQKKIDKHVMREQCINTSV